MTYYKQFADAGVLFNKLGRVGATRNPSRAERWSRTQPGPGRAGAAEADD